tara:strand:+ start:635 stop:1777 length:1143 start_codon:yes stop_codon:yes gene_type:complete
MKKLIFKKFIIDVLKTFIIICVSVSLIVWVIQAVKFLDFVTEDGHSFRVYFSYTLLNLPKIIHRILPFVFFISLFYQITQYEEKNELLVLWSNGVSKINFINTIIIYSIIITVIQQLLGLYFSPLSQDKARSFIRNSNIDFFPSLIKEGKFIDTVSDLTIFIDEQDELGNYKNIFLKDSLNKSNVGQDIRSQIIYAKSGRLVNENNRKYFKLFDGKVINNNNGDITNFAFERIDFNLDKYASKTTVFPKVQEVNTMELVNCMSHMRRKIIEEFISEILVCDKSRMEDVKQELLKRFYIPFYLPLLGLIISLLIIKSKENRGYNNHKIYIFFISFFIIVISEFSLRYSASHSFGFLFFITFPVFFFLTTYISLITKFKNKI